MIRCVVPVSGGKDSQACLKLALQVYAPNEVIGLFCDTRWEHPYTYAHIKFMRAMYGVAIEEVNNGSVPRQVVKHGRFPSGGARFCTEELKMRPAKWFYRALAARQDAGFEVWLGMRSKESNDREKRYRGKVGEDVYALHELFPSKFPKYLAKAGIMARLPVLAWTEYDVKEFVGLQYLNPMYADGFDRVGCNPCLAAGDKSKEQHFAYDAVGQQRRVVVAVLSQVTGKSVWTSKGGKERNESNGCMLCSI